MTLLSTSLLKLLYARCALKASFPSNKSASISTQKKVQGMKVLGYALLSELHHPALLSPRIANFCRSVSAMRRLRVLQFQLRFLQHGRTRRRRHRRQTSTVGRCVLTLFGRCDPRQPCTNTHTFSSTDSQPPATSTGKRVLRFGFMTHHSFDLLHQAFSSLDSAGGNIC